MSNLKKVVVTFCLMSVLVITALGGDIQSPPCQPPEPGDLQSPPCSSAQLATDDPTNPGETESPPNAETIMIITTVDAAVGAFLSLF
jgi:hypothetical protein